MLRYAQQGGNGQRDRQTKRAKHRSDPVAMGYSTLCMLSFSTVLSSCSAEAAPRASPAEQLQTTGKLDSTTPICIIGAGPGGIQLGHSLSQAGLDFLTLERNGSAGSYFKTFPVHRKLISLNKRRTGRSDSEFNLRHDW